MLNHDLDGEVEARGGAAAANGAVAVGRKRGKRRSWGVEEKIRIARESFASAETITAVAERHTKGFLKGFEVKLHATVTSATTRWRRPATGRSAAIVGRMQGASCARFRTATARRSPPKGCGGSPGCTPSRRRSGVPPRDPARRAPGAHRAAGRGLRCVGAAAWTHIATLAQTTKTNGVNPHACLKATLEASANGHLVSQIDQLLS